MCGAGEAGSSGESRATDEGKERLGGGGGVGGDVGGLGFLAVPEGRGFVLGVETGIQKREQLRGCGHGYS